MRADITIIGISCLILLWLTKLREEQMGQKGQRNNYVHIYFLMFFHPEVLYHININVSVNNTTIYFIYNKNSIFVRT